MTGLLAVAALSAQLSWAATELGRHQPRSEERAKGTRRHWEPILQDSATDPGHHRTRGQVCTIRGAGQVGAAWATVSSHLWVCTSWLCPSTASGLWPGSFPTLSRSWWSQSMAGCEPTWLGDTSPCLRGPRTISLFLVTLSKVVQVAHVTRLHAHKARKTLHVIVPGGQRSEVKAGVRSCRLGPRRAGGTYVARPSLSSTPERVRLSSACTTFTDLAFSRSRRGTWEGTGPAWRARSTSAEASTFRCPLDSCGPGRGAGGMSSSAAPESLRSQVPDHPSHSHSQ